MGCQTMAAGSRDRAEPRGVPRSSQFVQAPLLERRCKRFPFGPSANTWIEFGPVLVAAGPEPMELLSTPGPQPDQKPWPYKSSPSPLFSLRVKTPTKPDIQLIAAGLAVRVPPT